MRQGDLNPGTAPAAPIDPRARVRPLLVIWTGVLSVVVVSMSRSLPPVLIVLVLPYLALIAWHLLAPPGRRQSMAHDFPEGEEHVPLASPDPGPASPAVPGVQVGATDVDESTTATVGPRGTPAPKPGAARRRRREKPVTPAPSSMATFVPVAPGRYMRREEPDPAPQAAPDASGEGVPSLGEEPPGASPPDESRNRGTAAASEEPAQREGGRGIEPVQDGIALPGD